MVVIVCPYCHTSQKKTTGCGTKCIHCKASLSIDSHGNIIRSSPGK